MKWLFLGFCALGFFMGIQLIEHTEAETIQQTPTTITTNADKVLQIENRQLKEQITQLNKEIAQLKHTSNNNSSVYSGAASHQTLSAPNVPVEHINIESQIQEFNKILANGKDPMTSIKTNFASEAVDNSWASTNQHQLENFFKESFADVHPQYIECRSTRCRITVPVSDQKKISEISQTLMQGVFDNKEGIAKKIVIEPTTNDGTLNFYLARNEGVNLFQ